VDLSFYHGALRYRANFSKQMGRQSFSFRSVPQQRLKLKDLELPESLLTLVDEPRGLILATGPTGQGKSTTLRALIQEINETRALRIITIEDPVEYVFTDERSQFEQREVGIDTASFADGIRNAVRQDPNVIFVGEIRDRESIFAAMQAAETGHLVLTTLHADSVAQAIGRIREYYPAAEQPNLNALLARNTNAIICQRLLPNVRGTRTPCLEVMRRNRGVQEAIAANNLELLTGIIETAVQEGMHTFDQYLTEMLAAGIISQPTALEYAVNRHRLEMTLRGFVSPTPILRRDEDR
jgi:twitching motility protein PilT